MGLGAQPQAAGSAAHAAGSNPLAAGRSERPQGAEEGDDDAGVVAHVGQHLGTAPHVCLWLKVPAEEGPEDQHHREGRPLHPEGGHLPSRSHHYGPQTHTKKEEEGGKESQSTDRFDPTGPAYQVLEEEILHHPELPLQPQDLGAVPDELPEPVRDDLPLLAHTTIECNRLAVGSEPRLEVPVGAFAWVGAIGRSDRSHRPAAAVPRRSPSSVCCFL